MAVASGEFHRFVTLHLEEFPLVYDRNLPSTIEGAAVRSLLERLTGATDESVGRLARAFWKDGRLLPATAFDFRSVPFAEASLGYSRGVTQRLLFCGWPLGRRQTETSRVTGFSRRTATGLL